MNASRLKPTRLGVLIVFEVRHVLPGFRLVFARPVGLRSNADRR
jgi:hypothetical protein